MNDPPLLTVIDMASFVAKVKQAKAKLDVKQADPLCDKVERTVRAIEGISTVALLDLIGLPSTTGNARRISKPMQSLGYVPMKSRRFMPGGYRDTVTRGWARPMQAVKTSHPPLNMTPAASAASR
jgi:hypothetical protein